MPSEVSLIRFEPVRGESLDSQLSRRLLDHLLSGLVAEGERLPSERVLCDTLGVTRQSVRNAIKSLSLLGIIETRVGSGSYLIAGKSTLLPRVIEWGVLRSQTWATDLIDARCELEILLAGMAASRRSHDELTAIQAAYNRMLAAHADYSAYADADAQFHLAVANASGNATLAGVLSSVHALIHAWTIRVIRTAGETETSLPLHHAVYTAISLQDPEAARRAMGAHMERALRRLNDSQN